MNLAVTDNLRLQVGADRVVEPAGSLPQPAARLDPSGPVRPEELEVAVERLCLDSTSFRNLRERAGGDPDGIARSIEAIVRERGKMHNPQTDSGGVLLGTVSAVGERYPDPPAVGDRIAGMASLTLTPLRLDAVTRVDPHSPQIHVRGTAYVGGRAAWAPVPDDLPLDTVLDLYDVYAVATPVQRLAPAGGTVCVLGAGHAGTLALAAARDAAPGATLVAVDVHQAAVDRLKAAGLCDVAVATDLRDPLAAATVLRAAGVPPADLTVVVVNATGCEPAAILLTRDDGSLLFFSMATRFGTAALTADGLSSAARMVIGSGYAPDRGALAIELARRSAPLRAALGLDAA
jgi:L-erythro-3,5-diaminohexanoate dehydrogenase